MKILCREHDKYGSRKPANYIVQVEVTSRNIMNLQLRSMFNPELEYYLTKLDEKHTDAEVLAIFGNRLMRKEPYFTRL